MYSSLRSSEILHIYNSQRQTENEKREKEKWRRHLERSIHQTFPHLRLVLAGSTGCGFAVKGSDCDFTLVKQAFSASENGDSVLRQIKAIVESEERNNLEIEFISTAVVPILILNDTKRGLHGDISYGAKNTLYNTFLMRCYGEMDERVTPLVITIKTWAKNANIMNARYHKLSGFALVLLVLHYLQHGCSPPVLPSLHQRHQSFFNHQDPSRVADWLEQEYTPPFISNYESANDNSVEVLFKGFFRYYSTFNWSKVISVRTGGFIALPYTKKWTKPYIRIEDPSDLTNVTRAVYESYGFQIIKQAIAAANQKFGRGARVPDVVLI
ncbi:poly(A) RNA polymerase GLD2-like [Actinia tenebrosa]|uniref:Poly(A) RNA polymerase GLD2-like n=1 Tax=Actinia tenebrosa TaxID=6105 RepID=A0A6P8I1R1_ACTTE|nr:poly(A) RNA polymerase GLD2-like [Actinia tenebrosa]